MGIDIPFKIPKGSNIYIPNNKTKKDFLTKVDIIKKYIKEKKIKY